MTNRLRELRKAKGLTQTQLAELSNIPQPNISEYESGARNLDLMTLAVAKRLAKALGTTPDKLTD
ncbi:MAG: helix-turn-helix domain-containing protein [Bifidobacteriaceae bacterium]|jgi:transcriptional regulator with XRE-family HTH domain|nr:helix-turn-helix domain-containing protein [Bifidobacteriaceae bacterium]MCI1978174.1 helix-turn-helix domain-containing protein [Bifidobacteriaceae bacterium]